LLDWACEENFEAVLSSAGKPFDVIIGSELLYYKTDIDLLAKAVSKLSASDGVFIHAHIIRVSGHGEELIGRLAALGWETSEVPSRLVAGTELDDHPEWRGVRCFISVKGSSEFVHRTLFSSGIQEFLVPFREEIDVDLKQVGDY
jgi:hypothetical protein